jgi:very-short-patch-repair endonuclease
MSENSEIPMYFEAPADIFSKAKQLRSHMTRAEFIMWNFLKCNNVLGIRFRAQHPIGVYIADFFSFKLNLVIEIDGEIHNTESHQDYDMERTQNLKNWGIEVIRFSNYQVMNKFEFVQNEIIREVQTRLSLLSKESDNDPGQNPNSQ